MPKILNIKTQENTSVLMFCQSFLITDWNIAGKEKAITVVELNNKKVPHS